MNFSFFPILICSACVFLLCVFLIKKRFHKKIKTLFPLSQKSLYCEKFVKGEPYLSEPWAQAMAKSGALLKAHGVGATFFVHGTFVGDDPLDVFGFLNPALRKTLKVYLQKAQKNLIGDNGIFRDEDIEAFSKASGLKSYHFRWSSGNHHFARLCGALDLLKELTNAHRLDGIQRFLLIGHSHAGQIFALLSQMISDPQKGSFFIQKALEGGYSAHLTELEGCLEMARTLNCDFVTLGTPVRYHFMLNARMTLFHMINHRDAADSMNSYKGILKTLAGDYIQQWGSSGTDLRSPNMSVDAVNRALDSFLDVGRNLKLWRKNLQQDRSLPKQGTTLLVDYGDQGDLTSCITTLFGHGVYTRADSMLFQLEKIVEFLEHDLKSDDILL